MGKTGCGALIGMVAFAISFPGLGLALLTLVGVQFAGEWLGQHSFIVISYIVVMMVLGWGVPLFVAATVASEENIFAGILVFLFAITVASLIIAIPSSFVMIGACKAGNPSAPWVLRTVPGLFFAETFFAPEGEEISCSDI